VKESTAGYHHRKDAICMPDNQGENTDTLIIFTAYFFSVGTGRTVRGSNPFGGDIFRIHPDRPWGPIQPPVQWLLGLFPGGKIAGTRR
jgi:hypothetical protein